MKGKELKGQYQTTLKDGNEYKLEFTFNAIAEMEERFGDLKEGLGRLKKPSLKDIRFLLWIGLIENYDLTEKEVGKLIDFDNIAETFEALNKAIEYGFPMDDDKKK